MKKYEKLYIFALSIYLLIMLTVYNSNMAFSLLEIILLYNITKHEYRKDFFTFLLKHNLQFIDKSKQLFKKAYTVSTFKRKHISVKI